MASHMYSKPFTQSYCPSLDTNEFKLIFFLHVSRCVCVSPNMCGGQRTSLGVIHWVSPTFLRQVLSWTLNSPSSLGWLGTLFSCLPGAGITSVCSHTWLFCVDSGAQTWVLTLVQQVF